MGTLRGILIGWASLALAAVQAICVAAVALSGVRVLLGMTSLLAAGAIGPAHGFHRNALRIPILWIAGIFAALNLLLLWNENRIRRNPSAQWRPATADFPPTSRAMDATGHLALPSLVLILAEVATHPWFHIEH